MCPQRARCAGSGRPPVAAPPGGRYPQRPLATAGTSMFPRAGLDLNRYVGEADDVGEARLVMSRRVGAVGNDRDQCGVVARPDAP